jgi:hypothetical protein
MLACDPIRCRPNVDLLLSLTECMYVLLQIPTENSDAGGKMRKNIETPATCLAIYCHANGEDLGVLNDAGHWLCDTLGVHMLIPEYPGYGLSPCYVPLTLMRFLSFVSIVSDMLGKQEWHLEHRMKPASLAM